MEPNAPELTSLPKENLPSPKSFLPWIFVILFVILAGVWFFLKKQNSSVETPEAPSSTPYTSSSTQSFSDEDRLAIEKLIQKQIHLLSPRVAATGTQFVVHSIEHKNAGETLVVYSDTTATYTARGLFEIPEPKKINILAFDILKSEISLSREEKQLVEKYLKENISTLSPEKEVVGGKFYVTKIEFENNSTALVDYEDGHIALSARVNFQIENNDRIKILKWEMVSSK